MFPPPSKKSLYEGRFCGVMREPPVKGLHYDVSLDAVWWLFVSSDLLGEKKNKKTQKYTWSQKFDLVFIERKKKIFIKNIDSLQNELSVLKKSKLHVLELWWNHFEIFNQFFLKLFLRCRPI